MTILSSGFVIYSIYIEIRPWMAPHRERHLRLNGYVVRLPTEDPAHRILHCRDPRGWTMPRGRLQASWLRQVVSYLKDSGMAGLASA